ncbi:MAG: hypothetical protein EBT14_08480 [Betaproteobacteria bacterium]|nr:hypothetical protein [Betaproteobacteria bacterium]
MVEIVHVDAQLDDANHLRLLVNQPARHWEKEFVAGFAQQGAIVIRLRLPRHQGLEVITF